MNKFTLWFCRTVLLLDRIPGYKRYYFWKNGEMHGPHWHYMPHGYWGINILNRLGLLWNYIDYNNPGIEDWLEEVQQEGQDEEN